MKSAMPVKVEQRGEKWRKYTRKCVNDVIIEEGRVHFSSSLTFYLWVLLLVFMFPVQTRNLETTTQGVSQGMVPGLVMSEFSILPD